MISKRNIGVAATVIPVVLVTSLFVTHNNKQQASIITNTSKTSAQTETVPSQTAIAPANQPGTSSQSTVDNTGTATSSTPQTTTPPVSTCTEEQTAQLNGYNASLSQLDTYRHNYNLPTAYLNQEKILKENISDLANDGCF